MPARQRSFFERFAGGLKIPFRHAVGLIHHVADYANLPESEQRRMNAAVGSLFVAILRADGRESEQELERIEELFVVNFGRSEGRRIRDSLAEITDINLEECCRTLTKLNRDEQLELLSGMLEIGAADGAITLEETAVVQSVAGYFGIDDESVRKCHEAVLRERQKRSALVKSGAGIIVALVVLAIFVFTATFLKSVLLGLVMAYFFLPLQRWFQYRFFPNKTVQAVLAFQAKCIRPIAAGVQRIKSFFARSPVKSVDDSHDRRVAQACRATFATLGLAAVLVSGSLLWVSTKYMARIRAGMQRIEQTNASRAATVADASQTRSTSESADDTGDRSDDKSRTNDKSNDNVASSEGDSSNSETDETDDADVAPVEEPFGGGLPFLERYRSSLARSSLLRVASDMAADYLTDETKRRELLLLTLKNLQPILLRAGSLVTMTANLLLDGMLTLFFFSFFLQRIAAGQAPERGLNKPAGQYIVETIFESGWLPGASTESIREAQVIIDDVLGMLRTWVRGYLSIILVETILYVTVFMLLGIPYFPILGLIAGLTVLLPFIGPTASCSLTLLVTYSMYSQSVTLMVVIVGVYVFNNMIIEQLVLFPALVGEALGLNSLETIIVVLLGGVVAGLTGAVFAIPVAAILKYLVPRIYQSFFPQNPANP